MNRDRDLTWKIYCCFLLLLASLISFCVMFYSAFAQDIYASLGFVASLVPCVWLIKNLFSPSPRKIIIIPIFILSWVSIYFGITYSGKQFKENNLAACEEMKKNPNCRIVGGYFECVEDGGKYSYSTSTDVCKK